MKLNEFLKQFGMSAPSCKLISHSYFVVPDSYWLKFQPVYIGECIAHERGNNIVPSVDFLQVMGKQAKRKVVVNEKGEWLFICGRDLFEDAIVKSNGAKKDDIVVVLNQHMECIGYGRFIDSKIAVKRIFDIGDLLRREKKRKFR